MDFLVGDATGLLRRVDAATRCTYTYKMLPQDRNEEICAACWSGGPGLSATAASETELTLGRRSGRVEAMAPALPPRVNAAGAATSFFPPSTSASPHLLIRNSYAAAAPVVRCFQMPAACVQVGVLHEPQDRRLLNASVRDDLIHHDPFFSLFNSVSSLSPSPLLPPPDTSLVSLGKAEAAADVPDVATPHVAAAADRGTADAVDAAEATGAAVEAIQARSALEDPRLLFCIDEAGHLVLLDWRGNFFEQLRRDHVSSNSNDSSSGSGRGTCTPIYMPSVPSYNVSGAREAPTNRSNNGGDICSRGSFCNMRRSDIDSSDTVSNHTSGNSSSTFWSNKWTSQPAPRTCGMPSENPWYCWSLRRSDEEDEAANHIRAAWRVCGPVSCATPVNPLLPDRVAFGGRNNDVKVFDFSQGKYVWAAKNVKNTLLRLQVAVHISSLCWLPQVHPLVLAAGTAAGALRLYDLRCQRRPVFEQEYACSSSSLGGAAARERRVLSALCTETCDEEAAALLARVRKPCGVSSCNNNACNSKTTSTSSRDEKCISGSCSASNSSLSSSLKVNRSTRRSSASSDSSNGKVGAKHDRTTRCCNRAEGDGAGIVEATETVVEGEQTAKIYEDVRSLYGRENTRIFFSDNHGAVYVHRILTGKCLLRHIDPQQKKRNRTSCYAANSSSEAESEDEEVDSESQEDSSGGDEADEGSEKGEEHDEEESEEEETEGHIEAEEGEENVEHGRKPDKGQQHHEAANKVLLRRGAKTKRSGSRRKVNEDGAGTNTSITDRVTGGKVTRSETQEKSERDPRISATGSGADAPAGGGTEYGKRHAMQLLQQHRLKRMQKLSAVKNSGRLSQSSAHGPQYVTVFEGCYKGAMGAIVALNVDRSLGLLVGAGYGRHALVWKVRSRKLLFKVYLKQQLRTIVLRHSGGGRSHEVKSSKLLQAQDVQQEKQQQVAEDQSVQMSGVQQRSARQQQEHTGVDVKQKQKNQWRQVSRQVKVLPRREKTISEQKDHWGANQSTEEAKRQDTRIQQAQVRQCPPGQRQHQERQIQSKEQQQQSVVEEAPEGEQQGAARSMVVARKGNAAFGSTQKTSTSAATEKKRKLR